jgi:hypothetical protein
LRISSIQYDSPGTDRGSNASLNAEWVKITNSSGSAKTLTGWRLSDASGHVYKFPTVKLPAAASVKVHTGSGSNNTGNLYWRASSYIWNNTGDTATLRTASGTVASKYT